MPTFTLLIRCLLFSLLPAFSLITTTLPSTAPPLTSSAEPLSGNILHTLHIQTPAPADTPDNPQTKWNREKVRLLLVLVFFVLLGLFSFILLITIFRLSRFYRKRVRLGRKKPPTEPFDAWTNYRLNSDDHDLNDPPPPPDKS